MVSNKTFVYKKAPTGVPVEGEHLTVEDRPIDIETAPEGGLILEIQYASFDPYLRGRMRDPSIKSYMPPYELNKGVPNSVAGKVLRSRTNDFAEGDTVLAFVPIAEYARVEDPKAAMVHKVHNPHGLDLALFLGPLGMPGITAWSGLHKIGKPKAGETIFISSAAGAVGQVVGQIAKREGLTVIGSAGSDEKVRFITEELGFDGGFNYKKEAPADGLKRLAPDGLDIYWENVGGAHLEAALDHMKTGGRIPVCGMIENYNTPRDQQTGIRNLMKLIGGNIVMEGFLQAHPDFAPAYREEHQKKMQQWIAEGSIKVKIHTTEGIDNAVKGFLEMFEGKNFGKAVLKIR